MDDRPAKKSIRCDMEWAFFIVLWVHVLAVGAIFAGQAARFDVGAKINGLEIELVKSSHGGFFPSVRRR